MLVILKQLYTCKRIYLLKKFDNLKLFLLIDTPHFISIEFYDKLVPFGYFEVRVFFHAHPVQLPHDVHGLLRLELADERHQIPPSSSGAVQVSPLRWLRSSTFCELIKLINC